MEMARRNFLAGGALLAAGAVVKNASAMMPLQRYRLLRRGKDVLA
jgi:hypothetical protein